MAMVFGSESLERFFQSSWEMYVDNCRLSVICFSRIYISIYSWWKYRYPRWLLAISQCDWVGYSDVPVIVCTMTWFGGGFPSTGCIYPLGVCQREVDLHLLIHRPWYPCLREAESWCTSSIHLPLLLWTGSGVDFAGTSTLSGVLLQDCVTPLYSVNESGRLFAMCCKSSERMVQIGSEAEMCWTFH